MKTVAIIFLSVIGVFVTCWHEALIELTPGAKKETVPSFGEQIEWLLDYEYHWKELESVRESFRFKATIFFRSTDAPSGVLKRNDSLTDSSSFQWYS